MSDPAAAAALTSPEEIEAVAGLADARQLAQRSVHGAAITFAAQAAKFVVQFVSQIALARLLLPAEFGLVAMVSPIVGFVQLFTDFGLTQATIQRERISDGELTSLFWINAFVGVGLGAVLALASPLVAWFYGEPRAAALTASLAIPMVMSGFTAQHMALMNRRMRFRSLAAIDVGAAAAATLTGVVAALMGASYWSLVIMQIANSAAVLAAVWVWSGWRPGRPRREAGLGSLLRFGGNVTGFNVINYFSYTLDNVLIGATASATALGLYNRAFRLMMPSVMQLTTPFSRVAVPLLSRVQAQPNEYRAAYRHMLSAVLLLTAPGLVFCVVFGRETMTLLLGRNWAEAGPIFAWLAFGALLLPVNTSTSWLFVSQDRTREQLHWSIANTLVVLAAFAAGLPWGAVGVAAAASLASWAVGVPLLLRGVTRRGPVGLADIARAILPPAVATIAAAAALWGLGQVVPVDSLLAMFAGLALSYLLAAMALAVFPAGRRQLRDGRAMVARLRRSAG